MPTIREVMTKRVHVVNANTPLQEVARRMRDDDIGSVAVSEEDRLVGMITDRDIVVRALANGGDIANAKARDAMSSRILYCTEDQNLEEVLENMSAQQVRRLPVIDSQKNLVGVVSLGDLCAKVPADQAGESLKGICATRQ